MNIFYFTVFHQLSKLLRIVVLIIKNRRTYFYNTDKVLISENYLNVYNNNVKYIINLYSFDLHDIISLSNLNEILLFVKAKLVTD